MICTWVWAVCIISCINKGQRKNINSFCFSIGSSRSLKIWSMCLAALKARSCWNNPKILFLDAIYLVVNYTFFVRNISKEHRGSNLSFQKLRRIQNKNPWPRTTFRAGRWIWENVDRNLEQRNLGGNFLVLSKMMYPYLSSRAAEQRNRWSSWYFVCCDFQQPMFVLIWWKNRPKW